MNRLRMTRPGVADYEAEAMEHLAADQVPERGMVVPLRVHPQRADVVVLDLPFPMARRRKSIAEPVID